MTNRLSSKVALITGGARGQGRCHAIRLAQEGADIIAVDLCGQVKSVPFDMGTRADLEETVHRVEALGRRIIAVECDVRDFDALDAVTAEAVARLGGRLDIVSANAGIASPSASTLSVSPDAWADMIGVNLTGVWHTAKATVPHIRAGGRGGVLVLTSSTAGLKPYANIGHYAAAKHGVVGLMKTLAVELAPESIRVNSLHPTNVNTPMLLNEQMSRLVTGREDASIDEYAEILSTMHKLPTPWVEPSDVSSALNFLVSDEARFITGVAFPVDAGALLA